MVTLAVERSGNHELRQARGASWHLFVIVGLFSAVVNLLMLTGPLFMLQVYDRVLSSRSVETLTALFLLVIFLFVMMGLIDLARSRIMTRIALRFQGRIEERVFTAALQEGARTGREEAAQGGMRDLDAIDRLIASPVLMALFDLPWTPLFLGAVFLFHPLLGAVATAGLCVLVVTTLLNQLLTKAALQQSTIAAHAAERMSDLFRQRAEVIGALGMRGAVLHHWQNARDRTSSAQMIASDRSAGFTVFSRSFRLFLQSALLAAGAWLVLAQEVTPGAMIASSILMGRALSPIEQLVAGWPLLQRARDGWQRLDGLLTRHPAPPPRTPLPRPKARIEVNQIALIPPGESQPVLRNLSFTLAPGQALGVIGPSGAGKSTLARALIGAWPIAAGAIRIDGATPEQFDPDMLGRLIGYLPQQVVLFDGTIAENIARLSPAPDPRRVVAAAEAAAVHQLILDLPQGYDTQITQGGRPLSGGQIQRIGLARALYDDPVLIILDEPNSNLDNDGSEALNRAIRRAKTRGAAVIIMAHRPAAISECELLAVLEQGSCRAFGPRDKILRSMLRSPGELTRAQGRSGGMP